jgi:hypothetical protein
MLRDRDNVIEEFERQLLEKPPEKPKEPPKKINYRAIKGDLVDELIAKYINETQCPLPVKRLGDGNYLFGTKKVFAKILNGKIIIKVGGGFMSIDEFMQTYQDFEVQKVQQMLEKGMFNMSEYENQNFIEVASPNSKTLDRLMGVYRERKEGRVGVSTQEHQLHEHLNLFVINLPMIRHLDSYPT